MQDRLSTRLGTDKRLTPDEMEYYFPHVFRPSELAKLLKVSEKTIKRRARDLANKGVIRIILIGAQIRIPQSEAPKLIRVLGK